MNNSNSSAIEYVPSEAQAIGEQLLRDEQIKHKGLFMGCGLGKTATVLNVASDMLVDLKSKGFLVLAPLRVANLTWSFEHLKFKQFEWLNVANLRTKEGWEMLEQGTGHIYVINYESVHKVLNFIKGKHVSSWPFDSIVYDELTFLKNPKSKRAKLLRNYVFKLKRRWGLTGTPNPNSLLELYGQIRMLDAGETFGKSFPMFRDRYFFAEDYHRRDFQPHEWAERCIYKKIKPFCTVLKTSDYLDIPDIEEIDFEVALPEKHRVLYKEFQKELFVLLDEGDEGDHAVAVNRAVLKDKLLQITSGCLYALDENGNRKTIALHDAKIDAVKAIAKKEKKPLIVFCNFIEEQRRLVEYLPGAVAVSSAKTEKAQQELEKKWNSKKIPFLVSHPKSASHGLNLQGGSNVVVWTTTCHSGELYGQGNHRVARRGQKFPPKVYRILCKNTVDYAVVESLRHKKVGELALLDALRAYKKLF